MCPSRLVMAFRSKARCLTMPPPSTLAMPLIITLQAHPAPTPARGGPGVKGGGSHGPSSQIWQVRALLCPSRTLSPPASSPSECVWLGSRQRGRASRRAERCRGGLPLPGPPRPHTPCCKPCPEQGINRARPPAARRADRGAAGPCWARHIPGAGAAGGQGPAERVRHHAHQLRCERVHWHTRARVCAGVGGRGGMGGCGVGKRFCPGLS